MKTRLRGKTALLLDMNSTFMFGEDRFTNDENFFDYYQTLCGNLSQANLSQTCLPQTCLSQSNLSQNSLSEAKVQTLIRACYECLSLKYPHIDYRHAFPSIAETLIEVADQALTESEVDLLVQTFAHHERGSISDAYAKTLHRLASRFTLGLVIDIWSPKASWLDEFERAGVSELFAASSFSSDHGMVKPAPEPFLLVLEKLNTAPEQAVVIGDSARRDWGGAKAAGIDCILVGNTTHPDALAHYPTLHDFAADL